jgi:hypothetical protein
MYRGFAAETPATDGALAATHGTYRLVYSGLVGPAVAVS